jgi:hypothetical protein
MTCGLFCGMGGGGGLVEVRICTMFSEYVPWFVSSLYEDYVRHNYLMVVDRIVRFFPFRNIDFFRWVSHVHCY